MMKSIAIALKDFSIRFKDRKALIMMILMPIILTIILGSALKGVMGDTSSLPKTTVAVYQLDSDSLSNQFVENVLQDKKIKQSITVKKVYSQKELNDLINGKQADVGIVLPKEWGTQIENGNIQPAIIKVSTGKELESTIIQQLTESYLKTTIAMTSSAKTVMNDLTDKGNKRKDLAATGNELTNHLLTVAKDENQFIYDQPAGQKQVSSMQYYAAAMAAMFLLFNAMHGGKSIITERINETLARMMTSPTGKGSIIVGKFLGTLLYTIIQFLIFMGATHFLLNVNWGNNLLQTMVIALAYSISVSGLSMIVAAFIHNEKMADSLGGMVIQVLSLVGGSMIPVSVFPHLLRKISMVAPNSWALTSFTNIMSGTSWNSLIIPLCTLLGIGIIATLIGTWRLRTI
jgi:ABC-2 type transport system permease protein